MPAKNIEYEINFKYDCCDNNKNPWAAILRKFEIDVICKWVSEK